MPGIVEFPHVVQEAQKYFADLFCCEPQRRHLAEYLTGLLLAERKTVLGIHDEFAETTDQSCLNRFLTEVDWDVQAVNERRLQWLQEDPATRYSLDGIIAIDDVLIDHDGKLIEDVGWFWDHAEQRNKIAHDYLIANYVCGSGKHYPLAWKPARKRGPPRSQNRRVKWTHPSGLLMLKRSTRAFSQRSQGCLRWTILPRFEEPIAMA